MKNLKELEQKSKLVRKWSLISTTEAGSGHPTSCLSAAELGTVLFNNYLTYDLKNPLNIYNDRFVLSKGHAAPLLYTLFAIAGAYPLEELKTLRKFGSPLEGHPTPAKYPYAEAATGSLGQGLSIGAGLALLAKRENLPFKTYVLLGDGELAEGQNWEAANFASYNKLNNLIAIADINRLGQSQPTMFEHHIEEYITRFTAFGFEAIAIDGNNPLEVDKAFKLATENNTRKPFVIIAKTYKGKGISFLENKDNWHGKPLKKEDLEKALIELGEIDDSLRFQLKKPVTPAHSPLEGWLAKPDGVDNPPKDLQFKKGDLHATREIYGQAITELGKLNTNIYALDAEVKNSTFSEKFLQAIPQRFIECFIAEQNMIGLAVGLSRLGKIPFISTFAAFLSRATDQIRMARIGEANLKIIGSHAGVSIGEDGPSQMALEDFAIFGAIPDSVILHPADAVSTTKVIPHMVNHTGISYLRTLRPKTPVLYDSEEKFPIGGSKILRKSPKDVLSVVATGITVFEALKAYEELKKEEIYISIIDCYSIKPIDVKTLKQSLTETKEKILITVEDHYEHGGLGDFVLSAVADTGAKIEKIAVTKIASSGTPAQLLDEAGINAEHIIKRIKKLIK
jgi:transketolase